MKHILLKLDGISEDDILFIDKNIIQKLHQTSIMSNSNNKNPNGGYSSSGNDISITWNTDEINPKHLEITNTLISSYSSKLLFNANLLQGAITKENYHNHVEALMSITSEMVRVMMNRLDKENTDVK